ncbi:MAG: hypothetical protein ACRYHQ_24455 [Janthinobacterium lividum]
MSEHDVSPAEHLAAPLQDRNARLARCLGFFASVIKSGEAWSPACQEMYDEARALEPLNAEAWSPALKAVRTATDALNAALKAAADDGLVAEIAAVQQECREGLPPHPAAVSVALCRLTSRAR